tara:strand:+ start:7658 stop:7939 length:282 start_codon:yes stop_codon:yes gene_type:complete
VYFLPFYLIVFDSVASSDKQQFGVRVRKITLPTIIDIEASGFGAASYPIEIGVVRYDGANYSGLSPLGYIGIKTLNRYMVYRSRCYKRGEKSP